MNLFIGNLNYTVEEQELQELFEEFGQVDSAKIITDRATGRSKGFGFVEMPDDNEAAKAMEALDGREIGGRELRVSEARPRNERR